jgi:hypothetical protein
VVLQSAGLWAAEGLLLLLLLLLLSQMLSTAVLLLGNPSAAEP